MAIKKANIILGITSNEFKKKKKVKILLVYKIHGVFTS